MTYTPPSGWVEPYSAEDSPQASSRFHTREDCPRIRNPDQLRPVDRPYSAARCAGCADAYGSNLESFPSGDH
ncbi:MAG: hypothetical protein ABI807_02785 [Sporichthyaceae bacterium]